MVKKLIIYIFIYTLMVGCDTQTNPLSNNSCGETYLEVDAPDLILDENGYYHMKFLEEYTQTFSTLRAKTGTDYQKIAWKSNKEIKIQNIWTQLVNQASYTDEDGNGYTVLGVWEEFVEDTIKVWCGYEDECDNYFIDSLHVIVEN